MKKLLLVFLSLVVVFLIRGTTRAEVYGSISGRVTTDDGMAVEGIGIEITSYKNVAEKLEYIKIGKNTFSKISYTDKQGVFKYELFPAGKYYLSISNVTENYKELYKEKLPTMPVELVEGQNLTDINIKISRYYGILSGKVFKSDGITPFQMVTVNLFSSNGERKNQNYSVTDENGKYRVVYEPTEDMIKIVVTNADIGAGKVCFVDPTFLFSKPFDYEYDIVFNEENVTGFYGTVKNINGDVYDEKDGIMSIDMVNYPNVSVNPVYDTANGNYNVKGLVPGEYKFEFINIIYQGKKRIFKELIFNTTYIITNMGEQKRVDIIYDESKGETILKPIDK